MRDLAIRCGRLAGLLAAALSVAAPASAETPTLLWQGASKLRVQCLVETERGSGVSAFQTALCERIAEQAARGAPVPVSTIGFGDPEILAPGTVALLVHASVQPAGKEKARLLAFSIRPMRASIAESVVLFGSAPRAVALPASGQLGADFDAAITASLATILPWQQRPQSPRPLPSRQ